MDISIVIPSFNEENNIRTGALSGMVDYLKEQNYTWEIIVVDDGSSDKTADLAEKFAINHKNVTVLREPHRGKGGTVIAGMLKANGNIVIFDDMDQATPIDQLEKILPKFLSKKALSGKSGKPGKKLLPLMIFLLT